MNEGSKRPIVIVAACVLLDRTGAVLIAKRPAGRPLAGLWEFPGGKIEAGEKPEEALIRELHEELGIEIAQPAISRRSPCQPRLSRLHCSCRSISAGAGRAAWPRMKARSLLWVKPDTLRLYDMPPADEPLKIALSAICCEFGEDHAPHSFWGTDPAGDAPFGCRPALRRLTALAPTAIEYGVS